MTIKVIKTRGCVDTVLVDGCTAISIDCHVDGTLRVMLTGTTWKEIFCTKYSTKAYAVKKARTFISTFVQNYLDGVYTGGESQELLFQ